jgi:hypothetical protein
MKYEKPVVLKLGARGQLAHGDSINACVDGPSAGAGVTCDTGGTGGDFGSCVSGDAATGFGDCLSGSAVAFYCEAGAGGSDDPTGCTVGPSYA